MKSCEYCGRENNDDALRCRGCGTEFAIAESNKPQVEGDAPNPSSLPATPISNQSANIVATLPPEEARSLVQFLEKENIPVTMRDQTEASGLEMIEVIVDETNFDNACEAAGKWEIAFYEERQKKSGLRCPACGSWHLDYVPHESLGTIHKCKDCQSEFV